MSTPMTLNHYEFSELGQVCSSVQMSIYLEFWTRKTEARIRLWVKWLKGLYYSFNFWLNKRTMNRLWDSTKGVEEKCKSRLQRVCRLVSYLGNMTWETPVKVWRDGSTDVGSHDKKEVGRSFTSKRNFLYTKLLYPNIFILQSN